MTKGLQLCLLLMLLVKGYVGEKATWDFGDDFSKEVQHLNDLLDILEQDEQNFEDEVDLCATVSCGAGKVCELGECVCVKECVAEQDPRRFVCSNHNQTYPSDCHLYRSRCLCEEGSPECPHDLDRHLHIEYYGACRHINTCKEDDLVDFPRRMREWLFSVMQDLTERRELSEHYSNLEKEAELDQSKRWSHAAIWKWCDLDRHPHDNVVSRHELFPLRAPLHSLEHCISPFLDICDRDKDHSITLQEWSNCLELELDHLMAKCEKIDA